MENIQNEMKKLYKEYKLNGGTKNWNEFQHIHKTNYLERYCSNIEMVENYKLAKENNFKDWHLHHRLETHTSNGDLRKVNISRDELIALDMYYDRPAEELIFLTKSEHSSLHARFTDKNNAKISETMKELWKKEDYRKMMSEAHKGHNFNKGRKHTEEHKKHMSEAHKGKHWRLENGKRVWY